MGDYLTRILSARTHPSNGKSERVVEGRGVSLARTGTVARSVEALSMPDSFELRNISDNVNSKSFLVILIF